MPLYSYACANQHVTEIFLPLSMHEAMIECPDCHAFASQIITAPLMVKAQPECRYDSPVTGEHITTWQQRRNDLARTGSIPYDPEMKTDLQRRLKDEEAAMEKSMDQHVERSIEKMSTKQRGKLFSELTEQGVTAETVRK